MAGAYFPEDPCLKCSSCITVCPVYAVNGHFPGPKFIGPEASRLARKAAVAAGGGDYCTGCRQCEMICPAGVPITQLASEIKAREISAAGISGRDWLLAHNQWVSGAASRCAPLANWFLSREWVRRGAEKILGIKNRDLPGYEFPFAAPPPPIAAAGLKVAYFTGCYARYNRTGIARAAVEILRGCGIPVVVPRQRCCGVPLLANGLAAAARKNAVFNLRTLLPLIRQGYQVVVSCPSCALSLKADYSRHFQLEGAGELAERIWDISEFLLAHDLLAGQRLLPQPATLYYHQPCHTKAQGIGTPARDLLERIPGLALAGGEQRCCGQAGTYGFKKEKFATARAIGDKLFQDAAASGADGAVTECGMCSLQLAQGTGLRVHHPLEILGRAMGFSGSGSDGR